MTIELKKSSKSYKALLKNTSEIREMYQGVKLRKKEK
jgi:hypothetical protein